VLSADRWGIRGPLSALASVIRCRLTALWE